MRTTLDLDNCTDSHRIELTARLLQKIGPKLFNMIVIGDKIRLEAPSQASNYSEVDRNRC